MTVLSKKFAETSKHDTQNPLVLRKVGDFCLTASINSMGKSTATVSQFIAYFYRPYLNPSQWLNLLNGKQTLRDKRCVWGQLSLAKAERSDAELEAVWQALLSYWQDNFPKLKN